MTVYTAKRPRRRRWRRRVLTALGTVLILVVSMVGVVAWWANDLYGQITNLDSGVKRAQGVLNRAIPLPNQPATALVIGSDHRAGDGKAPSRSDTLMLVRIDPTTKYISLLSLPRDLWVDIPGHGFDKINAAYTAGGPKLAVQTVAALTGVRPNYLITVDFGGFIDLVNAFGGVYVNVDQHYYHVNTPGTEQYSQLDIKPGYQLLNGPNALAFSRYRHTDSDFYRNARQQLFLQAFEARASAKFHSINITDLGTIKSVAETIARNVEVTGPHGPPSISKMIEYASLAYAIKGRVLSVKLEASTGMISGISTVTTTPEAIKQAVYEWQHPEQVAKPTGQLPTATGAKPRKAGFHAQVTPSTVSVTVVNGNGVTGSAGKLGDGLSPFGYQVTVSSVPAPNFNYVQTWVYYRPGKAKAAADLVKIIGGAQSLPLPSNFSGDPSDVVVVVGHSFQGTTAVKPPKQTAPTGLPPDIVPDDQAYLSYFSQAARTLHFPVLYPTVQQTGSSFTPFDYTMPIRLYNIAEAGKGWNSMYAVFAMPNLAGAFWGIEETRFVDAPILSHPDAVRRLDGRVYRFYFNGSHIHLVAIVRGGIAYWVTNTLRDDLSNADMIAIARSLKPVH